MSHPNPSLSVNVDVTNPGQFFACCGLLELAHRLWPGAEGWFDLDGRMFHVHASTDDTCTLQSVVERLTNVGIDGELSNEEREELRNLESKKRALKKERKYLTEIEEERRMSLGKRQREGALSIGGPFKLRIAWWQEDGDDVPKTFAGRQEVLRMATAMLSEACKAVQDDRPLEYRCLLRVAGDGEQQQDAKVEPFFFDAARFAHALDAGFSLDVQEQAIRATAAALTEFLALIGLQRFRPIVQVSKEPRIKALADYFTWPVPLGLPPAAAVMSGAVPVPGCQRYRFEIRARDDQKRYGAFSFAIPIGGDA